MLKKIVITIFVLFCVACGLVLTWGYFTRNADAIAAGTIGGLASAIVGGGYTGRKRNEPTDKLNPPFDDAVFREAIKRSADVSRRIEDDAERIDDTTDRSITKLDDVTTRIENGARESGNIAARIREQIQKNKVGT
jgi:hypothetical protein